MAKRILFVSIAFPPKADPECIQAGRYFYYLSANSDYVTDVVTSRTPTLFMPVDPTLERYANVKGQLIEIPIYESKYVNYLLRRSLSRMIAQPDSKMTFHWQWRKVINQLHAAPDIIYSRSNPLSSSILAFKLSKQYNRPWIMHLSDPWTENPLYEFSAKHLMYHSKMETECFNQATIISFTSDQTALLYKRKYPHYAGKMTVFPNVYDPAFNPRDELQKPVSNRKRIVYTGGLANTRTAKSLLQALHLMVKKAPWLLNRFEVIFAGDTDQKNQEIFKDFAAPFIRSLERVSSDSASKLQSSADLLVVIDSVVSEPERAVFFPSKLLDYARSGKPVLSITGLGSVTEDFVLKHGGVSFSHESIEDLSNWLQSYVEGHITLCASEIDNMYAADEQASRLVELIRNITR
jgi:hypothetical protein